MTFNPPRQLCKKCCDAVDEFFPGLSIRDKHAMLWNATCYPMGCVDNVRPQLKEMRDAGCKTVEECIAFADRKLDALESRPTAQRDENE